MHLARLEPGRLSYQWHGKTYLKDVTYTITDREEVRALSSNSAFIVREVVEEKVKAPALVAKQPAQPQAQKPQENGEKANEDGAKEVDDGKEEDLAKPVTKKAKGKK